MIGDKYDIYRSIRRGVIGPMFLALGFDKLFRYYSKANVLHITYHGVVEKDSTFFSARHITSDQFERHLRYYKKHFDVLPTSQAFKNIPRGSNRKSISISFDDGFENNLTTVLPLLEKYKIPATFCVSSICTQDGTGQYLWTEAITALQYFFGKEIIELGSHKFVNMIDNKGTNLFDYLKALDCVQRDKSIGFLIDRYDLDEKLKSLNPEIWRLMTRDQLKKLAQSDLVEIGSHGHLHYNLGSISLSSAREELSKSKKLLEDVVGHEIVVIAYPDGSYNDNVKELAAEVGYEYQLAVDYLNISDHHDRRIVNRHGISSTTNYESNILNLNHSFNIKGIL